MITPGRLLIVRHGNTFEDGEPPRRIGIRTDLPLTLTGEAQADALGLAFSKRSPFTAILCGGLARTRMTAERIRAQLSDPPPAAIADWLNEIDHGPDEGRTEPEVLARIGPDALVGWNKHGIAPKHWTVNSAGRVAAWRDLYARLRLVGGDILVITSNGAARFALLAAKELTAASRGRMSLRTGAYGEIVSTDAGPVLVHWDIRPPKPRTPF